MITIQWVVYMVVVCCACLGVLFLLLFELSDWDFVGKRVVSVEFEVGFS